jgi:hypothetical protein
MKLPTTIAWKTLVEAPDAAKARLDAGEHLLVLRNDEFFALLVPLEAMAWASQPRQSLQAQSSRGAQAAARRPSGLQGPGLEDEQDDLPDLDEADVLAEVGPDDDALDDDLDHPFFADGEAASEPPRRRAATELFLPPGDELRPWDEVEDKVPQVREAAWQASRASPTGVFSTTDVMEILNSKFANASVGTVRVYLIRDTVNHTSRKHYAGRADVWQTAPNGRFRPC